MQTPPTETEQNSAKGERSEKELLRKGGLSRKAIMKLPKRPTVKNKYREAEEKTQPIQPSIWT